MKKWIIAGGLTLCCAFASANDLATAKKFYEQKQFQQAMQVYQTLADAGNTEAQRLLAEMYWYGDGTAIDDAKAEVWFKKAAAGGDAQARASLDVMRERVARQTEIAYYTTRYDGADVRYTCNKPAIPEVSKVAKEIQAVSAEIAKWSECYDALVTKLNASLPPGKAIPADIARLMSDEEIGKARTLMDRAYAGVSAQAQKDAAEVSAKSAAWYKSTMAHVAAAKNSPGHNTIMSENELRLLERQKEAMVNRNSRSM
ncbi:MAG TPA: sel1 repeat family protein [Burkholderiaceae bacterium]